MSDKFTILTATYNCERYIVSTINSVIIQDYSNWEMIIIDDRSKDATFDIVSSIKDDRITCIRNIDKMYCGLTYSRLLQLATGKYCGVLDGDDTLCSNAISTVIEYYEKYPKIDFIWTKHKWWNESMTKNRNGLSSSPKKGNIYASETGFKHVYSHWRTFKTHLREKAKLFKNMKCTVDKELGYTLEEVGMGGFLPIELYNYRYHKGNMSHHSKQRETWKNIRAAHKRLPKFRSTQLAK